MFTLSLPHVIQNVCSFCTMWVFVCVLVQIWSVTCLYLAALWVIMCSCMYNSSIYPACLHVCIPLFAWMCNLWVWSSSQFVFSLDPGCGRQWSKIVWKNAEVAWLWPPPSCPVSLPLCLKISFFRWISFFCYVLLCLFLNVFFYLTIRIFVSSMVSFPCTPPSLFSNFFILCSSCWWVL